MSQKLTIRLGHTLTEAYLVGAFEKASNRRRFLVFEVIGIEDSFIVFKPIEEFEKETAQRTPPFSRDGPQQKGFGG